MPVAGPVLEARSPGAGVERDEARHRSVSRSVSNSRMRSAVFTYCLSARWVADCTLPAVAGEVTGYGTPRIAGDVNYVQAIVIEAALTFFLVSAVFGTAVSSDAPSGIGGFGIGLVLLFGILVGGPLTGAAMNPARAFGPAVVAWEWIGQAVFWIGPLLGGAVAALLWSKILLPEADR